MPGKFHTNKNVSQFFSVPSTVAKTVRRVWKSICLQLIKNIHSHWNSYITENGIQNA